MLEADTKVADIKSWQIGKIKVTRIPEWLNWAVGVEWLLKAGVDDVLAVDWLQPDHATPDGDIIVNIQAMIIEAGGKRIMVDPCIGNEKPRSIEFFNMLQTPFLERLNAAGFPRETIDFVLCTHLHADHVGWNTILVDGKWVPTFPNARYLFARQEFEYAKVDTGTDAEATYADSIGPVVAAGLVDLVESNHVIVDGVRLEPSPGHTPGHCVIVVSSGGEEAVITGDTMHHPLQIARPNICSSFCWDEAQAIATRKSILDRVTRGRSLLLGTHFSGPTGVNLIEDGDAWRVEKP